MELCQSNQVFSKLSDPSFQNFWDRLYEICPWKTVFQSRLFVSTWYQHYQSAFEPVLVFSTDADAPALLPLARTANTLVIAGAHQAEYQAWLAREGDPNFLPGALRVLKANFNFDILSFKYLPPGFPTHMLPKEFCRVQSVRRPLMRVNPSDKLVQSLNKKSNKSRLNGLKQRRELVLEHITDAGGLSKVLDEVILMYDFRQGAVNNSVPFEEDQQKKAFHIALAELPGLMHCSVLRSGNQVFAALLGLCSQGTVHSGVFAHSPFFGKYSPGKLHLLLLGMRLQQEGFTFLDLTPGGAEWKDRFATEHDEVHRATLYRSRSACMRAALTQWVVDQSKRLAGRLKITPEEGRIRWRQFAGFRVRHFLKKFKCWLRFRAEVRVYRIEVAEVEDAGSPVESSRDKLRDLMNFPSTKSEMTRTEFLSAALRRLERGDHHVYLQIEKETIVRYAWLIERREREFLSEVQQELHFAPNSTILLDFSASSNDNGQECCKFMLTQMISDAVHIPGTDHIYACVRGDDLCWRHAIENAGFDYQGSLFLTVRMGRSSRWTSLPSGEESRVEEKGKVKSSSVRDT